MNNSQEVLSWYKSQIGVKLEEANEAHNNGDYVKGNYLTHEASNYVKRANEIEKGSKLCRH